MTDNSLEPDLMRIEELTQCGLCKTPFNDTTHLPKDLACMHTFCSECIQSDLQKGSAMKGSSIRSGELYCHLCWKLTELTEKGPEALETNHTRLALVNLCMKLKEKHPMMNGDASKTGAHSHEINQHESCLVHGFPSQLWCFDCKKSLCTECQKTIHAELSHHSVYTLEQANEHLKKEAFAEMSRMSHMDDNVRLLAKRQRQFLFLIRDACNALTREVQSSLDSDWNVDPTADIRTALTSIQLALVEAKSPKEVQDLFSVLLTKKQALQTKRQEMIIQCKLNDLIGHSDVIFDFDSLNQAVRRILASENEIKPIPLQQPLQDPILFLTNYCMSQLFSRLPQRPSIDSTLMNHNVQRESVIPSEDIPFGRIALTMPSPPQTLLMSEPLEIQSKVNDPNVPQVEYPQHQPVQACVPINFDNRGDVELSRPSTPPDTFPSPPTPQTTLSTFTSTSPATTAQVVQMQSTVIAQQAEPPVPIIHPPVRPVPTRSPANTSPRYFFYISINGTAKGQIVIETRPDVAPKMCRNFDRLTTADKRASYKGCSFFQCWKSESVITGDYEFNTGRGGRSIYEEGYFQPDDTRLQAVRGAVGMRRQQKKHDHFGLVGSQFRIILQDVQGFTGIFGHVVEGIELIDLIASHGDQTGKPIKPILITKCGKLT